MLERRGRLEKPLISNQLVRRFGSSVLLLGALSAPFDARAQTVRYELDSATALQADGWNFVSSGATASYDTTGLTLQSTVGYAEWMLRSQNSPAPPTTGWLGVLPGRGYWVEAKLRVSDATQCQGSGAGLWIDDGKTFIRVLFEANVVHFLSDASRDIAMNTTDAFHVYRVQSLGGRHAQLLVDGKLVLDNPALQAVENGKALMFGDLGGCQSTKTAWDYVAYDTFGARAEPGDSDNDGVANSADDCVLIANADQADADHDGVGDACDVCQLDADNDQDNDGLCANQDACPSDPRNDQDHDGVCDTEECAPFASTRPASGVCPPICSCPFVGNDPFGGFGGGLDQFLTGGSFSGGTSGASGSSSGGTAGGSGGTRTQSGGTTSGAGLGGAAVGGAGGPGGGRAGAESTMAGSASGGSAASSGSGASGGSANDGTAGRLGAGTSSGEAHDESVNEHGGCGCRASHGRLESRGWCALALGFLFARRRRTLRVPFLIQP
jgi:hypothetical protein